MDASQAGQHSAAADDAGMTAASAAVIPTAMLPDLKCLPEARA